MGRGDRKDAQGQTAIRSYGNARPHKVASKTTGSAVKKAALSKPPSRRPRPQ